MAMGTRENEQTALWVATSALPSSPGHPFYTRLNAILEAEAFDRFVEDQCRRFYAPIMGRPGLAPGRYFRLLLIGPVFDKVLNPHSPTSSVTLFKLPHQHRWMTLDALVPDNLHNPWTMVAFALVASTRCSVYGNGNKTFSCTKNIQSQKHASEVMYAIG